ERSCINTTDEPFRAAAKAAHIPAIPPPTTHTSTSISVVLYTSSPFAFNSFSTISLLVMSPRSGLKKKAPDDKPTDFKKDLLLFFMCNYIFNDNVLKMYI